MSHFASILANTQPALPSIGAGSPALDRPVTRPDGPQSLDTTLNETARLILDSVGDGVYGLDLDGFVTFVNPAAQRMTGWTLDDLRGRTQHSMVHHSYPDGSPYDRHDCPIYKALKDGEVHHRNDEVFWRKNSTSFPVAYTSTPIIVDGVVRGAVVLFRDITLKIKEQFWQKSQHDIFTSIVAGEPLEVSMALVARAFHTMRPDDGIIISIQHGERACILAHAGPVDDPASLQQQLGCLTISAGKEPSVTRGWTRHDSHWASPLLSTNGDLLGDMAVTSADPSFLPAADDTTRDVVQLARHAFEHAELQKRLVHQLRHDHLTGLPNRALLEDRLGQAILSARRRGTSIGVCYIDIDHFKQINDTLGHAMGDEFLKRISKRLGSNCRVSDTLARQGGDEFILILPELGSPREAEDIIARLLDVLREPFTIGTENFSASASIGISVYPDHGHTAPMVMQNADAALYAAKRAGRNQAQLYAGDLGHAVPQAAATLTRLPVRADPSASCV